MNFTLAPVGIVHSPFQEKFGVPRQPGLVNVESRIEMLPPYNQAEAFRGLEAFSHIWVSFIFHQARRDHWQPTVRPPRLGGNARIGVFASRAPYRPNNLGLSVVALRGVENLATGVVLKVQGLDVIDQTPVIDIKPYLPYADSVPNAAGGFADDAPQAQMCVTFSDRAKAQLQQIADTNLPTVIAEVLSYDVRPAYREDQPGRVYGMRFSSYDIKWQVSGNAVTVVSLVRC